MPRPDSSWSGLIVWYIQKHITNTPIFTANLDFDKAPKRAIQIHIQVETASSFEGWRWLFAVLHSTQPHVLVVDVVQSYAG